jgi:D-arabinose 1-dehydrogenase-like Zn-dependent alcohol dehydrogenase
MQDLAERRRNAHTTVKGYAALSRGTPLQPFEYSPGPLGADQVEIAVNYSGVCQSDISMIDDAWGFSAFPWCRATRSQAPSPRLGRR